ncbi:hypothetical protein NDU88_002858 [Pleurodeles waltl]|uniref:Uncharacterized protein n=1 Tax=Pleurodeles waltl TaxID=8319 RepID=A0AAV7L2G1_PLEWA|nr:hypothetical protein NDU88_002858 [Pleurodeles waltl]
MADGTLFSPHRPAANILKSVAEAGVESPLTRCSVQRHLEGRAEPLPVTGDGMGQQRTQWGNWACRAAPHLRVA